MSRIFSEDVLASIKELIIVISEFNEDTEPFNHILKYFISTLRKSDTMYFLNKREVDQNISSMSEKFCFHGFFCQADALKAAYKIFFPEMLPKPETNNRLNIVKFLLCMSESPTKHFIEHPELYVHQPSEPEEDVDWAAYLNEGIDTWNPNFDESSDGESFTSIDANDGEGMLTPNLSGSILPKQIKSSEKMCVMDFKINREELLATIQHTWYIQEQFFMEPESQWREANIGILWESHLREQVQGLILLKPPSFISEYKVIREVLWQLWCPHTSSTLELSGNNIRPRPDVTLASVRSYAFYTFLGEFIPYIETLDFFREFEKSLQCDLDNDYNRVSRTYQSYCNCLKTIITPVYKKLCDLEEEVRQQETTYTLLRLAANLKTIFEPIKLLREIHDEVILDLNTKSPLQCATTLLHKLHKGLKFTSNKLEQDLKMALFLESIYHYVGLVDYWLIKDDLSDYTGEFLIEKTTTTDGWHTIQFNARNNIDADFKQNSFFRIFLENVLKIGKNINFLRLLRKYDIIGECQESIYDEFIRRIFEILKEYYNVTNELETVTSKEDKNLLVLISQDNYIFPVVGTDISKTNPEVQKLENLVDIEDGFLMTAFADFFVKKPVDEHTENISLYDRISQITTNLFPKTNMFENILLNILEERFTISGLMVKNLLIEEHLLEKQFEFLKYLYLFHDDIIFPFYRRLFEKTESSNKQWANDIWLTSHIQDIFMDIYPEFYEKCSVQIKDGWSLCTDSLSACSLINVNYEMPWPLNIIIKQEQIEMYKDIFQFLLKLKWALHTLNHLIFSETKPLHDRKRNSPGGDGVQTILNYFRFSGTVSRPPNSDLSLSKEKYLEIKSKTNRKSQKTFKESHHRDKAAAKLIRLKFCLINILNSLQHFVFGFVFSKNLLKFELDFEKAYDLNSLIESHEVFINSVSQTVKDMKQMLEKDKHDNVVNCVKLLKLMWNSLKYATPERISDCNKMYQQFYSDISPIIFPVYVFDY